MKEFKYKTDMDREKTIRVENIIHEFDNECGERFVIFFKENKIWITGDEHAWEAEELFRYHNFVYNSYERIEIKKVFSLNHI